MKRITTILLFLSLTGCTFDPREPLHELGEELAPHEPTAADFDPDAREAFDALATDTGGALVEAPSALALPSAILHALEAGVGDERSFDLMIVLDRTGSMRDDIRAVKAELDMLLARIEELGDGTQRVGLFTYTDQCVSDDWYELIDLTSAGEIREHIEALDVGGGGDTPESVYDAVELSILSASWENPNRFAIVIGDAGPQQPDDDCYLTTHDEAVAAAVEAEVIVNVHPILVGR